MTIFPVGSMKIFYTHTMEIFKNYYICCRPKTQEELDFWEERKECMWRLFCIDRFGSSNYFNNVGTIDEGSTFFVRWINEVIKDFDRFVNGCFPSYKKKNDFKEIIL